MKKNKFLVLGLIGLMMASVLFVAGCKKDIEDAVLIGKWYDTQAHANDTTWGFIYEELDFKDDGTVMVGLIVPYDYTVSGNVITVYDWLNNPIGTIKYSISGTVLTLFDPVDDPEIQAKKYYKPN